MTEPGTASTSTYTGSPTQGPEPDPVCKELKKATDAKREELGERSTNKKVVGPDGEGTGTTVSAMKAIASDGTSQVATAHNNMNAFKLSPSGMVEGASSEVRSGEETPLCPESEYKHPAPAVQKSGHAEARLIGALGGAKAMTLTFRIDWRPGSGGNSSMPCPDCHRMMCAARKDCEFNITLCDKKGQPHELTEEHCSLAGYQSLLETMGELE